MGVFSLPRLTPAPGWTSRWSPGAWFRRGVAAVLRSGGPVPAHVAIVMDGNRRFARSRNLRRELGHAHGADKLLEVLEWCLALGVRCLSVYAFSTDNFRRSDAEVTLLFELAERRLDEMATSDAIRTRRVRVQVLGELHLLPASLQRAAARVMAATWHHEGGPVLNVCFAYTGREDIAQAVAAVGDAVRAGRLHKRDVDEDILRRCLHGSSTFHRSPGRPNGRDEEEDRANDPSASNKTRSFSRTWGKSADPLWDTDDSSAGGSPARESSPEREWTREEDEEEEEEEEDEEESAARERLRSPSTGSPGLSTRVSPLCGVSFDGGAPVDLLVRTSGETRLSDFILWGVSGHAVLCFLEVLWPDFSFTDMCHAVWTYQRSSRASVRERRRFEYARRAEAERRRGEAEDGALRESLGRRRANASGLFRRDGSGSGSGSGSGGGGRGSEPEGTSVATVTTGASPGGVRERKSAFVAERIRAKVDETLRTAATETRAGGCA